MAEYEKVFLCQPRASGWQCPPFDVALAEVAAPSSPASGAFRGCRGGQPGLSGGQLASATFPSLGSLDADQGCLARPPARGPSHLDPPPLCSPPLPPRLCGSHSGSVSVDSRACHELILYFTAHRRVVHFFANSG